MNFINLSECLYTSIFAELYFISKDNRAICYQTERTSITLQDRMNNYSIYGVPLSHYLVGIELRP